MQHYLKHKATLDLAIEACATRKYGTLLVAIAVKKMREVLDNAESNSLELYSIDNFDELISALENVLCGFSAQMCTTPNTHVSTTAL